MLQGNHPIYFPDEPLRSLDGRAVELRVLPALAPHLAHPEGLLASTLCEFLWASNIQPHPHLMQAATEGKVVFYRNLDADALVDGNNSWVTVDSCTPDLYCSQFAAAQAAVDSAAECASLATEYLKQLAAEPSSTTADIETAELEVATAASAAQAAQQKLAEAFGSPMAFTPATVIGAASHSTVEAGCSHTSLQQNRQQLLDLLRSPQPVGIAKPPQEQHEDQRALWACLKQHYSLKQRLKRLRRFLHQDNGSNCGPQLPAYSKWQLATAISCNLHWLGKSFLNGHKVGDSWVSQDRQSLEEIITQLQQEAEDPQTVVRQQQMSAAQLSSKAAGFKQLLLDYKVQSILSVPEELAMLDAQLTPAQKQAGRRAYAAFLKSRAATALQAARDVASLQGVSEHHPLVTSWFKRMKKTPVVEHEEFLQWAKSNTEQIWYDISNSRATSTALCHFEGVSALGGSVSVGRNSRLSTSTSVHGSYGRVPTVDLSSRSRSPDSQQLHRLSLGVSNRSSPCSSPAQKLSPRSLQKGSQSTVTEHRVLTEAAMTTAELGAAATVVITMSNEPAERDQPVDQPQCHSPEPLDCQPTSHHSSFSSLCTMHSQPSESLRCGSLVMRGRSQLSRGCLAAKSFSHANLSADFQAKIVEHWQNHGQTCLLQENHVTTDVVD